MTETQVQLQVRGHCVRLLRVSDEERSNQTDYADDNQLLNYYVPQNSISPVKKILQFLAGQMTDEG